MSKKVDIHVHGDGPMTSVFLFEPITKKGERWIRENVAAESWQWLGRNLAVESGFARDLAEGMIAAGLVLS